MEPMPCVGHVCLLGGSACRGDDRMCCSAWPRHVEQCVFLRASMLPRAGLAVSNYVGPCVGKVPAYWPDVRAIVVEAVLHGRLGTRGVGGAD